MKIATLSLALVAATASAAQTPNALKAELLSASNGMITAAQQHDAAKFTSYFAPEFVEITPNGIERDTAKITNGVMGCNIVSFTVHDAQVTSASANSAILVFRQQQQITCGGHALPEEAIVSDTFVKRGGRWLVVLHTDTPAATAPKP